MRYGLKKVKEYVVEHYKPYENHSEKQWKNAYKDAYKRYYECGDYPLYWYAREVADYLENHKPSKPKQDLLSILKKSLCVLEPSEMNDIEIYVDEDKLNVDEINIILDFIKPENKRKW